jgi:glycosyltransferase involved in cell wall biosynthesis
MQRAEAMRRKIAFLVPDMSGGGAERVALTLIKHFAAQGHAIDLLLTIRSGELLSELPDGVRVFDLRAPRIRNALRPIMRYLQAEVPDALQVSMWPLTIVGIIARMLTRSRARLVVSDHAILSDHYPKARHGVISATVRLFYPRADARVAVSNGAARDLADLARLPLETFTVIANPIDFPGEINREPEVEALWQGASRRVLTLGQLKEEKNQGLLIRAFARLPRELNARLMIVGSGSLRSSLEDLAKAEGVSDRVTFAGYANDPWPYYGSADLFVLPSREESFGNVLVEAMHAGLPIVSTANTGAREILGDGTFGRLVPVGDDEALASAMLETLDERVDQERQKVRARDLSDDAFAHYEQLLLEI